MNLVKYMDVAEACIPWNGERPVVMAARSRTLHADSYSHDARTRALEGTEL